MTTVGLIAHRDECRLAAFLAARFGADRVLDIGSSDAPSSLAAVLERSRDEVGPDVHARRQFLSTDRWISLDACTIDPPDQLLRRSIVLCANVIQILAQRPALLRSLARMSRVALATIMTSPEGARDLPELTRLLESSGISPAFIGFMRGGDSPDAEQTIVAIADCCPVAAGREPPAAFRPLALMPTYNDLDIAPQTVTKLLDDGCDVYVRDNWSTDGTFERLRAIARGREGLCVGRFPDDAPSAHHDYLGLLRWKEDVAARHPGRWIVSVDSDEVRSSPWSGISFRGGLYICERMGFTAVDLTVLNFRPIDEGFSAGDDPERAFRYFEFGGFFAHHFQIKTWRQGSARVDLTQSAGHDARFERRRVFPYKFLLKHYPLRNSAQASRKIFTERKPRYAAATRAKGWHVQYDRYTSGDSFVWNADELIEFDEATTRSRHLVEVIAGIGIGQTLP
jgi:hypothetical protein